MKRIALPFKGDWLARAALIILVTLLLVSIIGPLLPGMDARASVGPRLTPPSSEWLLGTDSLGRAVLPRLLEAIRTTFFISVCAVAATTIVASLLGILSAVVGGALDQTLMRVADAFFAFPAMLLAILVSAIIGAGELAAVVAIIIISIPLMLRVIRGAALSVVHRDFVTSSRVGGATVMRISLKHVLPNVAGVVAVQATFAASIAMLTEGALSFLGFGVVPPAASLGSLVQEGTVYLTIAPWAALIPGTVLALAILSLNLLGDGLRDTLDPRTERSLS